MKPVGRYDVALLNPAICNVSLGTKRVLIQITLTLSICQILDAVRQITQMISIYSLLKISLFLFTSMGLKNSIYTASEEKDMLNRVLKVSVSGLVLFSIQLQNRKPHKYAN